MRRAEEAGDVLVVEIEPGPASVRGQTEPGGQRDGRVAERGEDVPGRGDGEKDQSAGDEMEALRAGGSWSREGEVEQDEAREERRGR